MMSAAAACLVLVLGAGAPPAEARAEALHVDLARDGAIAAAALALSGASSLLESDLAPSGCRWCGTNQFDRWARGQLLWSDPEAARRASNVAVVVVPAGAAAALALSGLGGPGRRMLEDFVLVAQAFGVTMLGDRVVKLAVTRQRPYAHYGTDVTGGVDDRLSFWSAHSALTFSAATSAGTVARLRGYSQWPWILGLGVAGATATAWFRVAGDRHWASDVLAGAAWGSAVGVAVPLLHVRSRRTVTVIPVGKAVVLTAEL